MGKVYCLHFIVYYFIVHNADLFVNQKHLIKPKEEASHHNACNQTHLSSDQSLFAWGVVDTHNNSCE